VLSLKAVLLRAGLGSGVLVKQEAGMMPSENRHEALRGMLREIVAQERN